MGFSTPIGFAFARVLVKNRNMLGIENNRKIDIYFPVNH